VLCGYRADSAIARVTLIGRFVFVVAFQGVEPSGTAFDAKLDHVHHHQMAGAQILGIGIESGLEQGDHALDQKGVLDADCLAIELQLDQTQFPPFERTAHQVEVESVVGIGGETA